MPKTSLTNVARESNIGRSWSAGREEKITEDPSDSQSRKAFVVFIKLLTQIIINLLNYRDARRSKISKKAFRGNHNRASFDDSSPKWERSAQHTRKTGRNVANFRKFSYSSPRCLSCVQRSWSAERVFASRFISSFCFLRLLTPYWLFTLVAKWNSGLWT